MQPGARRVLHVMNTLERSGMEMMFLNSAQEWKARNINMDLVATARHVGPLAEDLARAGYGIFHMPFRSSLRYLPESRFVSDFRNLCKRAKYDVVHIHTEAARPLFAVLARSAQIPRIVFTVHNTFRFRGILRGRKYLERRVNRALGGRYGMVSDAVLACEWERFHNPGVRIHNWMNTKHFRPPSESERRAARRHLNCAEGVFVVCTVGNCDSAKNHTELIRALAQVKREFPVFLLHVGREEPDHPERRLAAELRLEENIRFVGSQPDALPYLWAADAFVMPSLHEGMSIAALEAIAAGTPAILTKVSGLDEIAMHTKWAAVCEPHAISIAYAIKRMVRTPPEIRLIRALEDSAQIREEFSEPKGVNRLISALYEFSDGSTPRTPRNK